MVGRPPHPSAKPAPPALPAHTRTGPARRTLGHVGTTERAHRRTARERAARPPANRGGRGRQHHSWARPFAAALREQATTQPGAGRPPHSSDAPTSAAAPLARAFPAPHPAWHRRPCGARAPCRRPLPPIAAAAAPCPPWQLPCAMPQGLRLPWRLVRSGGLLCPCAPPAPRCSRVHGTCTPELAALDIRGGM